MKHQAQNQSPRTGHRSAIFAQYSSKYQRSIEDQVRECKRWATEDSVHHIFSDKAVTGRSSRREGLKALQAALEAKEVDVVIVFATSRLFRKQYKSLSVAMTIKQLLSKKEG